MRSLPSFCTLPLSCHKQFIVCHHLLPSCSIVLFGLLLRVSFSSVLLHAMPLPLRPRTRLRSRVLGTTLSLEQSRTSSLYSHHLECACEAFFQWSLDPLGEIFLSLPPEARVHSLCTYIQHLYDCELPYAQAKHAVIALQDLCSAPREIMRRAWRMLSSWQLKLPLQARLPLPGSAPSWFLQSPPSG